MVAGLSALTIWVGVTGMSMLYPYGWHNTSIDGWTIRGGLLLQSVILTATVAAGTLIIYEGQEATSGRLIVHLTCVGVGTYQYDFYGLPCNRGVYLDLDAAISEAVVLYQAVPS